MRAKVNVMEKVKKISFNLASKALDNVTPKWCPKQGTVGSGWFGRRSSRCGQRCQFQAALRKQGAQQLVAPLPVTAQVINNHFFVSVVKTDQRSGVKDSIILFHVGPSVADSFDAPFCSHCSSASVMLWFHCRPHFFSGIASTLWRA
jgi:hypothetical protein